MPESLYLVRMLTSKVDAHSLRRRRRRLREVLPTWERWTREGTRAAMASGVRVERSAPRGPGAVLAVSETGEVSGSVTGGCVEPAVIQQAEEVLAGGGPRLLTYGISDEEGFEVGLACGGTVHILVEPVDPEAVSAIAAAVREDRPLAVVTDLDGPATGRHRLLGP